MLSTTTAVYHLSGECIVAMSEISDLSDTQNARHLGRFVSVFGGKSAAMICKSFFCLWFFAPDAQRLLRRWWPRRGSAAADRPRVQVPPLGGTQ